jgi:Holliday junction DNA helicase RuvB
MGALIENPPHLPKNYLFTGQPSTGKTTLAKKVATALDLPFIHLDGRSAGNPARLFEIIDRKLNESGLHPVEEGTSSGLPVRVYPPLAILIDEVHLLARPVQEGLLTMLEQADRRIVLSNTVARVHQVTFMFATTRKSDIDRAFVSRCTEIPLLEYTMDEVTEILRVDHPHWPEGVLHEIAVYGRGVPRIAKDLAKDLETEARVSEHSERTLGAHLAEVVRSRGILPQGLTMRDVSYLRVLRNQGRPVGETTIQNLLGTVDPDTVSEEIEPFLMRLGYITMTTRGRMITADGIVFLNSL